MRLKKVVLIFAALTMVVVGLSACGSLSQSSGGSGQRGEEEKPPVEEAQKEGAPTTMSKEAKSQQLAPAQGSEQQGSGETENLVEPPEDKMMRLTIPEMDQIKNDEIPTGLGTDDALFHDYAAVHLESSGFPWQKEANVYIAGHRLGFQGTDSYLAFYDLNELEDGDEFTIEDAKGRVYTYDVFNKFVAQPANLAVINPVEGKNIVSLQTCTLPDYTKRLIVRGKLKDIKEA
jgi:sortase A